MGIISAFHKHFIWVMQIFRGLVPGLLGHSAVTIGNFDGVHLGHQALLKEMQKEALKQGLPTVLITFWPSAKQFFSKSKKSFRLSSFSDNIAQLSELRLDNLVVIRFNQAFSEQTAEQFLVNVKQSINPKLFLIGDDFRFGFKRQGNKALMRSFFSKECEVKTFPEVLVEGQRISSTAIRKALQEQQLNVVNTALGRPYSITGRVCYGRQLGQTIGVPTANLSLNANPSPLCGVFCVELTILSSQKAYFGVANIGVRPTVDGRNHCCEVHLFDFSGSLYGKRVQVRVLERLRDEKKFEGIEALTAQIKKDIDTAKDYFKLRL